MTGSALIKRDVGRIAGLPLPLIPPDCDLRNYPFTPMFRARLFGSSFHARASDAEWRAGVTLWLKSWDQVPAGSLPDDDIDLCRLAELGRDLKTWRKVKPRALHGWVKCSDSRLYHPVVTEGVLEAWGKRRSASTKGKAGAVKRWGLSGSPANADDTIGDSPAIEKPLPDDGNREGEGEGKETTPLTPGGGGDTFDPDFARFLTAGGERWRGMRAARAAVEWENRRAEGVSPALLAACAKAYMAWRDGEDARRKYAGTVVGPVTFLREHWTKFRGDAALLLESAAPALPDWNGRENQLAALVGAPVVMGWFSGSTVDDGPPPVVCVRKSLEERWIRDNFMPALERVFGQGVTVVVRP